MWKLTFRRQITVRRLASRPPVPPLRHAGPNALEALRRAADILRATGASFWITYGTLLGWHRHGGFIPYDEDIDLAVLAGVRPALLATEMARRGFSMIEESAGAVGIVNQKFLLGSVLLDFYFVTVRGSFHVDQYPVLSGSFGQGTHPIQPTEPIDFHGISVEAPVDPEAYLAHLYGPDWRQPVERWSWIFSPRNVEIHCLPVDIPRLVRAWISWKLR